MATVSAPATAPLDVLRGLLDSVRRATRRWVCVEALAWVGVCGGILFWSLLWFDWLVEPPAAVRAGLMGLVLAGLGWLLWTKLVARLAAPLDDRDLAMLVERGHPAFRDSLSTAIELGPRPPEGCDPTLLGRTIDEAAAVAGQVDVERLFRRRRLVTLACGGVLASGTIAALALALPAVADTFVRRMVLLRDDPWPRRTGLAAEGFTAGVRTVARGSDVDVLVRADAARELPRMVELRSRGRGAWRTDRMGIRGGIAAGGQTFGHVLRGVTEDLALEVRGGDARIRGLSIRVLDPPALADLRIGYTLPEYLGGGRREAPAARLVQVPRGSVVEIVCRSTKPLHAARLDASAATGQRMLAEVSPGATGDAPTEITGTIGPLEEEVAIAVRLEDTDRLENREPIGFLLAAVPDEPPTLAVRLRGISTAITPRARLPLVGTIADDHGVAAATVIVEPAATGAGQGGGAGAEGAAGGEPGAAHPFPIKRVAAGTALVDLTDDAPEWVPLEPLGLKTGTRIGVAVRASDACGLASGPNSSTSDIWPLDVVTPEELMAMLEAREIILRRRFESVVADLTQARDRLAVAPAGDAAATTTDGESNDDGSFTVGRLGESAARAAGETGEIASAFRDIRLELDNNALLTPELDARLIGQIADPLAAVATTDLPGLAGACRDRGGDRAALVAQADQVLARLQAILDKMIELESYNEVLELLRGVIRTQEEIRAETLERQKRRAREALERP
jgi:hypothetical protein